VFTTHPGKPPPLTADAARSDTSYYWTGQASTPRSLQRGQVNISIYAPQYESSTGSPIPYLQYEDYTHAFFPTEHFDQVVEQDGWVIGRKGDGYVALWSWRPTQWRTYAPGDHTLGLTQRFDLVAPGGADDVWITEVGRRADWASSPDPCAAFVAAITTTGLRRRLPVTPGGVDGGGVDAAVHGGRSGPADPRLPAHGVAVGARRVRHMALRRRGRRLDAAPRLHRARRRHGCAGAAVEHDHLLVAGRRSEHEPAPRARGRFRSVRRHGRSNRRRRGRTRDRPPDVHRLTCRRGAPAGGPALWNSPASCVGRVWVRSGGAMQMRWRR
jgi:hypothetical protein